LRRLVRHFAAQTFPVHAVMRLLCLFLAALVSADFPSPACAPRHAPGAFASAPALAAPLFSHVMPAWRGRGRRARGGLRVGTSERDAQRERAFLSSTLFFVLTMFTDDFSAFYASALTCQMGLCDWMTKQGTCSIPLVPHAPGCLTTTRCVRHCPCYEAAYRAHLSLKDVRGSTSGSGVLSASNAGASGGAGASASGSPPDTHP